MKKVQIYLAASFLYLVIIGLFFMHLWHPEPQLFLNPEYGRSDVSHFNIPVRLIYHEALTRGEMPLWTRDIGSGFPLYAESQIGAYFLPNLAIFSQLPFWAAFNMSYVVAFLLGAMGMFALIHLRTGNMAIGWLAGLWYVFSGFFIAHTNHLNMLQAAALIPWMIYLFDLYRIHRGIGYGVLFALVAAQQIFAGHLQTSFIAGVLLIAYASIPLWEKRYRDVLHGYVCIVLGFIGAFILAAVQVLPSLELHGLSVRSDSFSLQNTTQFSFHPKSFLTFLDPHMLGRIQDGTYKFLQGMQEHGTIYWETQAYSGLLVLVLVAVSLAYIRHKHIWRMWVLIILAGLLMMARYSPLYIAYSIPPFNLFTTPARFLIMFIVFVLLLTSDTLSLVLQRVQKRTHVHRVLFLIIVVSLINIFAVWYGYGVRLPVETYMQQPETAAYIDEDASIDETEKRIFSVESGAWNEEFTQSGWTPQQEYATYFNEISPNMNVLWGLSHHKEYVGRIWTQRKFIYDQYLLGMVHPGEDELRRVLAGRLLSLASIDYVVSAKSLGHNQQLAPVFESETRLKGDIPYTVYQNTTAVPRIRLTDSPTVVASVEDVIESIVAEGYTDAPAFIEESFWQDLNPDIELEYDTTITHDGDRQIEMDVSTNKEALLVLADLYYPGWEAYIDGQQTSYYPVNIIQRALVVPEGEHTVTMHYTPPSYQRGKIFSILAHLIALSVVFRVAYQKRLSFSPTR